VSFFHEGNRNFEHNGYQRKRESAMINLRFELKVPHYGQHALRIHISWYYFYDYFGVKVHQGIFCTDVFM
jgi:hypothetical protein